MSVETPEIASVKQITSNQTWKLATWIGSATALAILTIIFKAGQIVEKVGETSDKITEFRTNQATVNAKNSQWHDDVNHRLDKLEQ